MNLSKPRVRSSPSTSTMFGFPPGPDEPLGPGDRSGASTLPGPGAEEVQPATRSAPRAAASRRKWGTPRSCRSFPGMRTLRTPDERFATLPDFGYAPHYADVPDPDGGTLRMSWVEDGPADGEPVLLLHGEPSWSFLYRRMIPPLAGAGLRVVAVDLVGFGRSDKPAEIADHSYARHVEWVRSLVFDVLDLRRVTLVGQDWGGLIGL